MGDLTEERDDGQGQPPRVRRAGRGPVPAPQRGSSAVRRRADPQGRGPRPRPRADDRHPLRRPPPEGERSVPEGDDGLPRRHGLPRPRPGRGEAARRRLPGRHGQGPVVHAHHQPRLGRVPLRRPGPGAAVTGGVLGAGRPRGRGQADQRRDRRRSSRRSSGATTRARTPTPSTPGGTPAARSTSVASTTPRSTGCSTPAGPRAIRRRARRSTRTSTGSSPRRSGTCGCRSHPGPWPRRPTSTASSGPTCPTARSRPAAVSTAHSLLGLWIAHVTERSTPGEPDISVDPRVETARAPVPTSPQVSAPRAARLVPDRGTAILPGRSSDVRHTTSTDHRPARATTPAIGRTGESDTMTKHRSPVRRLGVLVLLLAAARGSLRRQEPRRRRQR